jgi:hypothetical protein
MAAAGGPTVAVPRHLEPPTQPNGSEQWLDVSTCTPRSTASARLAYTEAMPDEKGCHNTGIGPDMGFSHVQGIAHLERIVAAGLPMRADVGAHATESPTPPPPA